MVGKLFWVKSIPDKDEYPLYYNEASGKVSGKVHHNYAHVQCVIKE
jgi:hypothetical protein